LRGEIEKIEAEIEKSTETNDFINANMLSVMLKKLRASVRVYIKSDYYFELMRLFEKAGREASVDFKISEERHDRKRLQILAYSQPGCFL
jgi:hypothetical protein